MSTTDRTERIAIVGVGVAQEESKFYKLELQNRDKNYNEVFGRAPNVGVLQVRLLPPVTVLLLLLL